MSSLLSSLTAPLPSPLAAYRKWQGERRIAAAINQQVRKQMRSGQGLNAGFAGAGVSRLTASMATWSGAVNADMDASLVILRARARALAANNEFGKRFVSMVATNVIGANGPALQVRALGPSGKLDKSANDAIETHWQRWGEQCDISGRMGFTDMLKVGIMAVARDGECIIRKVRGRNQPYGISLQLLEADRLDEALNQRLPNGNIIRQGVECDSTLRPIAYWVKTAHPGENYNTQPMVRERVDAADIIHIYLPTRAEQVRGFTWFHAVLMRTSMLHGFEEAAVIAARIGASKMGFFEREAEAPSALENMADGTSAAGMTTAGGLTMTAEPGEFGELPPGYKFAQWNPEYPHANFESFVKQCMRGISAGLDVAAHNLSADMTDVNYSSARIAELAEREMWMALQGWFIRRTLLPLYKEWLASALIRGNITFEDSGKALPADKLDKFANKTKFQGRRWNWVDPLKEAEANKMNVDNGFASRTQINAEQGREFDDIVDELRAEKELLAAAGIVLDPQPVVTGKPPTDAPPVKQGAAAKPTH